MNCRLYGAVHKQRHRLTNARAMHPDPDYTEQQLCRWLLTCLDRSPSNESTLTQEMIAGVPGVRREGITEVAGTLQHAGLIHYRRGHITVLDPDGLEKRACECCQAVKMEFDRLLPNVTATDASLGEKPPTTRACHTGALK